MDNLINKKMPVSIEAEQALLGSLIINPESFDRVGGLISVEDFYLAEHKHIYAALLKMFADKQIAPYRVVEEKEEEIGRLNREIGRLEGIIEENGLDARATVGKKIVG